MHYTYTHKRMATLSQAAGWYSYIATELLLNVLSVECVVLLLQQK